MSNNKMLIDATHPEETRVVVLRGGRVEEFDYESAARKLLRGNIYLAKVTRVEPSLQAAFVDYGGNRHGFLAFNEIHPDYYQIPMADRQALLDEEAAAEAEEEAAADARAEALARRRARTEGRDDDGNGNGNGHRHGRRDRGDRGRGRRRGGSGERDAEGGEEPHSLQEAHHLEPHDAHDEHDASERYATADIEHVHDDAHDEAPETIGEAGVEPHESEHHDEPAAVTPDDEPRHAPESTGLADEVRSEPLPDAPAAAVAPVWDDASVVIAVITEDAGARVADAKVHPHDKAQVAPDAEADDAEAETEAESIEQVGAEDATEEVSSRPRRRPRSYKIQEVIKRRQVILIQVVKEERGNKGAALTTYLSLAGRYTVLMPNTARGGGISRKITQPQDRKRLKAIAAELEVPEGMGLIIRTAGAARTKQEIKRDFEYLLRLWESVRELTLRSVAPSLVYEEGNLIKRSIRDLYNKDVEEVIVAGREAHAEAHDFMRMLMPSHAKNVIEYREPEPLFTRFQIERQLNAMFSPYVTLRSGGYLVINQTEALVAIDVNSGKSTREFSIEETALNTNLEAAEEIARQLKLRDLAGLIVIDFIDMEERRNNRKVENRLKDALRFDRARIQVGRISHFGLLEMSRQRLRTGVLEGSTSQCPHCQGTGIIRSTESVALAVLRGLEDAIMAGARTSLVATTTPTVALYILNHKRQFITDMEHRTSLPVMVQGSDKIQGANFTIEKGAAPAQVVRRPDRTAVNMDWGFEGEDDADAGGEIVAAADDGVERGEREPREMLDEARAGNGNGEERRGRRRRRRRGGRRERGENFDRLSQGYDDRSSNGEFGQHDDFAANEGEAADDHHAGEVHHAARDAGELHRGHDDVADDQRASAGVEAVSAPESDAEDAGEGGQPVGASERSGEGDRPRRRRRGRRGGRRNRDRGEHDLAGQSDGDDADHGEPNRQHDDTDDHAPHAAANDDVDPDIAYEHEAEGVAMTHGAADDMDLGGPGIAIGRRDDDPQPDIGNLHARREPPDAQRQPRRESVRERHGRRREEPAAAGDMASRNAEAPSVKTPLPAVAEPPQVAPIAPPMAEEPTVAVERERRPRGEPVSGEPKIERVVVRADQPMAPEAAPVAEADKPVRKGWWSRTLGRD